MGPVRFCLLGGPFSRWSGKELRMKKQMIRRRRFFLGYVTALVLLVAAPTYSAIYKYKDNTGKVHFTDDLNKIPPQYRTDDKLKTMKGAPPDASAKSSSEDKPAKEVRTHYIKARLKGGSYVVDVMFNNSVKASLIVDTGASMIFISEELGKKLGARSDHTQPTLVQNTAGGQVKSPMIILSSVKVGTAEVKDVEAGTNPHFPEGMDGLLGMNFLNEFKMEMDRENSQLILRPLASHKEPVWGGHNGKWWKTKFNDYTTKLANLNMLAPRVRHDFQEYREVRNHIRHYTTLLDNLKKRADQAGVPREYRSPG